MSDWFRGLVSIERGQISFKRDLFRDALKKHHGQAVLILRPVEEFRTPAQNRYYWGVVVATILGHPKFKDWTDDQVHDAIKEKFLSRYDPSTGLTKVGSTKDLKKHGEFSAFKEEIQQYFAEHLDLYIADPNEDVEPRSAA